MSLPNQLIVSGAGTAAANGTYTRGADFNGFAAWYKDTHRIFLDGPNGPGFFGWRLRNTESFSSAYAGTDDFLITNGGTVDPNSLPVFTAIGAAGQAPAPTVTAAPEGGGGGGSSSPAVKIENANVKFFGKTKFVV